MHRAITSSVILLLPTVAVRFIKWMLLILSADCRAEMRAKGRHGREMEESFCFLAASDQMAAQIYQHGLRVGNTVQHALGKPSHGVYLFKHVDVALNSTTSTLSAKKLLIFKVSWMFLIPSIHFGMTLTCGRTFVSIFVLGASGFLWKGEKNCSKLGLE